MKCLKTSVGVEAKRSIQRRSLDMNQDLVLAYKTGFRSPETTLCNHLNTRTSIMFGRAHHMDRLQRDRECIYGKYHLTPFTWGYMKHSHLYKYQPTHASDLQGVVGSGSHGKSQFLFTYMIHLLISLLLVRIGASHSR